MSSAGRCGAGRGGRGFSSEHPARSHEELAGEGRVYLSSTDLLRGDYKQSEYGKVILPLTVLRRLDCVLEPTKEKVLERAKAQLPVKADEMMKELRLCQAAGPGMTFYNTSRFVFQPTEAAKARRRLPAFRPGSDRRKPDEPHRGICRQRS